MATKDGFHVDRPSCYQRYRDDYFSIADISDQRSSLPRDRALAIV